MQFHSFEPCWMKVALKKGSLMPNGKLLTIKNQPLFKMPGISTIDENSRGQNVRVLGER